MKLPLLRSQHLGSENSDPVLSRVVDHTVLIGRKTARTHRIANVASYGVDEAGSNGLYDVAVTAVLTVLLVIERGA